MTHDPYKQGYHSALKFVLEKCEEMKVNASYFQEPADGEPISTEDLKISRIYRDIKNYALSQISSLIEEELKAK